MTGQNHKGIAAAFDRGALNAFLKDAGFARSGDLVFLEPEHSETKEIRRAEKAVVATISTRARDRHGDIVDPAGVRLDRFRKNPVVLYAHSYDGLPVARSLWERVRESDGGRELVAKPQFHLDTELSREVWALISKGVLSAWSVGFIPERWEPAPKSDDGGSGDGNAAPGFVVKKWDLLEYSCVPVPSNFEALTHELKSRRITAPALVKSLAPLGMKAPDLVPTRCRAPAESGASCPAPVRLERTAAKVDSAKGTDPISVHPRSSAVAIDVRGVVKRAFDLWLARARGGE